MNEITRCTGTSWRTPLARSAASLGLIAFVLGVPIALGLAGSPLPGRWPHLGRAIDDLRAGYVPTVVLVKVALFAGWCAWIFVSFEIVAEARSFLRHQTSRRAAALGPLQPLVAKLVATAVLSMPLGGPRPMMRPIMHEASAINLPVLAVVQMPTTMTTIATSNAGTTAASPIRPTYVVRRGDTLWGIAERYLGDPLRWQEIAALNEDRSEGTREFVDPHWIYPGWTLVLPADAKGLPALSNAQQAQGGDGQQPPASAPTTSTRSPSSSHTTTGATRTVPQPVPAVTSPRAASPAGPVAAGQAHGATEPQRPRTPAAPIGLGILGVGLLALLVKLRRVQERHRRPGRRIALATGELVDVEHSLHAGADPVAASTVDRAIRLLGQVTRGVDVVPTVLGAVLTRDRLYFVLDAPLPAPVPFTNSAADRWCLEWRDPSIELALLSAGEESSVLPSLVTIGEDEEGLVLLNLEAGGVIAIAGDGQVGAEVATAIALELSSASWVECCELYDVGVGTGEANPNYCTTVSSLADALPVIAAQHTSMARELDESGLPSSSIARLSVPSERWAPLIVISNEPSTKEEQTALSHFDDPERYGLALVILGELAGAHWRLVAHSDGTLEVPPLARRVRAQRVARGHLAGIAALLGLAASRADVAADAPPYDAIDVPNATEPEPGARDGDQPDADEPDAAIDAGQPSGDQPFEEAKSTEVEEGEPEEPAHEERGPTDAPEVIDVPTLFTDDDLLPPGDLLPDDPVDKGAVDNDAADEVPVTLAAVQPAPKANLPAQVEICVLGPLEFIGLARAPDRGKVAELIVWLALHPRGASIDTIATALSPNGRYSDKTLRNYRYEARRALGVSEQSGDPLLIEHNGLVVGPEVSSDWVHFRQLASGDRATRHAALALVRGRPFGETDWPWLMTEGFTALIDAEVTDCAEELANEEIERHDYPAAVRAAEQGLLANSYDERLFRILMQAHHRAGNPAAVRATMRRLTALLEDDVEPFESIHPETRLLYEAITARPVARQLHPDDPPEDGDAVVRRFVE